MSKKVIDFNARRNQRDADRYRLLQAAALIELFRRANGHPPETLAEMHGWVTTANLQRPIDPYAVLTEQQIRDTLAEE